MAKQPLHAFEKSVIAVAVDAPRRWLLIAGPRKVREQRATESHPFERLIHELPIHGSIVANLGPQRLFVLVVIRPEERDPRINTARDQAPGTLSPSATSIVISLVSGSSARRNSSLLTVSGTTKSARTLNRCARRWLSATALTTST